MFENKKIFVVCGFLGIILIIGAFFLGSWNERRILSELIDNKKVTSQPTANSAQTLKNNDALPQANDEFSKAVESGNIKDCEKLANQGERDACTESIAVGEIKETGDASICTKIQDAKKAEICKDNVAFSLAEKGDVSNCNSISNETSKTECISNAWRAKAAAAKDASVCDNITNQTYRDLCKNDVANPEE